MDNILDVVCTDNTVAIALGCDIFGSSVDDQQISACSTWYQYNSMSVGFPRCLGRDVMGLGYGRADLEDDEGRLGRIAMMRRPEEKS